MKLSEKRELYELLLEKERRIRTRKILGMYPDEGLLSRDGYPKHMRFFRAGPFWRERAMVSANRVGKTEGVGGYELVLHLTGRYPDWWEGRRFSRPVRCWAAGTTNQTTKDILQYKLLGPMEDIGTGLIPGDDIVEFKRKASSVPDTVEAVFVNHYTDGVKDGVSVLGFKSYEQGRKAFEGVEQDVILLDEEAPADVYEECLIRTMTTDGLVMLTFTPLQGVSDVVLKYMPGGKVPADFDSTGKFVVQATWDDAPHLTDEMKKQLFDALPPNMRDARSRGIPSLGSGAIYPIAEDLITVDDFKIPDYWPRVYGFDVGWKATAAVWVAIDRDAMVGESKVRDGIVYVTSCYRHGFEAPEVHVHAVKARGDWIPGVADPASRASNQRDGEKLLDEYISLGLKLQSADSAVEAGIFDVWERMSTGRFKVFRSCSQWFDEFRVYYRNERGKVVKENDHLMDCTRYLVRSGLSIARQMPLKTYAIRNFEEVVYDNYNPLTFGMEAR